MIKIYNKRMDLSVKSSIAVLMNIGMRKRTYILMLINELHDGFLTKGYEGLIS